jgi:transcriptional regulator with XRE-family HTH domain
LGVFPSAQLGSRQQKFFPPLAKRGLARLARLTYAGAMATISRKATPRPTLTTAGARIKAARIQAGLTQEDLAREIGVSRSAVAQWETDRAGQIGGNLARIAEVLAISVGHLLTGGPRDGANRAEDATELALLRLYRACTAADRGFLLRTATRLARQSRQERRRGGGA